MGNHLRDSYDCIGNGVYLAVWTEESGLERNEN